MLIGELRINSSFQPLVKSCCDSLNVWVPFHLLGDIQRHALKLINNVLNKFKRVYRQEYCQLGLPSSALISYWNPRI